MLGDVEEGYNKNVHEAAKPIDVTNVVKPAQNTSGPAGAGSMTPKPAMNQ